MRRCCVVLLPLLIGCKGRSESAPETAPLGTLPAEIAKDIERDVAGLVADEQATAKQAKGTIAIARAWRVETGPTLAPGRSWVLIDVDFGALSIDTDDLELFDPDRKVVSAIGDVRRLDDNGALVSFSGAHANAAHYLLAFETETATKRVSLRYWGETLTASPVEIAANGPVFAEPAREVVRHLANGERHVLVFEDHHQEAPPSATSDHIEFDGGECVMHGMVPVSSKLDVVDPSIESIIRHAFYAADYRCAKPPTRFGLGRARPIPAAEPFTLPAATLEALEGRGAGITLISTGGDFSSVAVRHDGSLVAIAPEGKPIQLVDASGKEQARLASPGGEMSGLGFTPDGAKLWSVDEVGGATVWDVKAATKLASRRLEPEPDMYSKPKMTSDGRWLVIDHPWFEPGATRVAWSGQLTVLALPALTVTANVKIIDGSQGSITDLALSGDGKRAVVCATTETESVVRVLGIPRGEQLVTIRSNKSRADSCAFAADGRILVGTEAGDVEIYDRGGKRRSTLTANRGGVTVIVPRADGSFLSGGADGTVLVWKNASTKAALLFQHKFPVHDIQLAGDLVATKAPHEVAVLTNGRLVKRLAGSPDGPSELAIAPGVVVASELAIHAKANRVRIWRPVAAP